MTTTDIPTIDGATREAFVGQAVVDRGAPSPGCSVPIGDRLGLYQAMAGAGPLNQTQIAGDVS
jgi:hypothetical protein